MECCEEEEQEDVGRKNVACSELTPATSSVGHRVHAIIIFQAPRDKNSGHNLIHTRRIFLREKYQLSSAS